MKNFNKLFISFVFFMINSLSVSSQNSNPAKVNIENKLLTRYSFDAQNEIVFDLFSKYSFTSLIIKTTNDADFRGSYILLEQDTFWITQDQDQFENDSLLSSNMIVLPVVTDKVKFYSGKLRGKIEVLFIDGSYDDQLKTKISHLKHLQSGCTEPESVSQTIWRAGLPSPNYSRIFTDIEHLIVHHAAGSNTETDFIKVVRSYYIYHTQDKGWSDIGYNYLIAQDGTIFKGRDPGTGNQDDVQGAHYCAKNGNTMGICLLGNYMDIEPPDVMVDALINLLSWKINKNGLDPLGSKIKDGFMVGSIAGHRDGCNTACPGDKLYARLDEIRQLVSDNLINNCTSGIDIQSKNTISIYPNPCNENTLFINSGDKNLDELIISDMFGKKQIHSTFNKANGEIEIDVSNLIDGVFVLKLITAEQILCKFVVIQ